MLKAMVEETLSACGMPVKYLPRRQANQDLVFGEDPTSHFDTVYTVNAMLDSYENFGDTADFYSKFDIAMEDKMTLSFAKSEFLAQVGEPPEKGDLLYQENSGFYWEVSFVDDDDKFYPTPEKPQHTWVLSVEPWVSQREQIAVTGDADIDAATAAIQTALDAELAQNAEWDIMDNDVLNLDETNPFGDYT